MGQVFPANRAVRHCREGDDCRNAGTEDKPGLILRLFALRSFWLQATEKASREARIPPTPGARTRTSAAAQGVTALAKPHPPKEDPEGLSKLDAILNSSSYVLAIEDIGEGLLCWYEHNGVKLISD